MMPKDAPEAPTVFIVDDDQAMRHSLEFLLGSLGHRVRSFASAEAFLEAWVPDQPGCLVLDIRMPGMSGLQLQRHLNERGATLSVLCISGHGDIPMVVRAMRAGAMDFLEKPFNDQTLLDRVAAGLRWSNERWAQLAHRRQLRSRIEALTPRERAVMVMVTEGLSNKQMALALDISVKTVEVHRAHVMEKTGAPSVAELTRMLIEADEPTVKQDLSPE